MVLVPLPVKRGPSPAARGATRALRDLRPPAGDATVIGPLAPGFSLICTPSSASSTR